MWQFLKQKYPFFFFLIFFLIFFRKVFFLGLLPIPSDMLVSFYFPFSSGGFSGYSEWTTRKGLIADDAIRQQYPWKVFASREWMKGNVPLWNPYAFSGYPQAANLQTGAFYPFNIFFVFLDPKIAWTFLLMLGQILSALFMYLFLKSQKLSSVSAVFGSLIFLGMTFELLWFEQMIISHTTLWLPLVLLSTQKIYEKKYKWIIIGALSLSLSLLAGYAQTTLFVYIISSFFYIYKLVFSKNRISFLIIGLSLFFFSLLISSIQLIPTLEIYFSSAREGLSSQELFGKFLATPRHLLTLFSSDFFGNPATENFWGDQYQDFNLFFGLISLCIALTGIINIIKNKLDFSLGKWFLILALTALLFSFSTPLSYLPLKLNIPILSTGVPARFIFIFQFSFCIVCAISLDKILKIDRKKLNLSPVLFMSIITLLLLLVLFIYSKQTTNIVLAKNLNIAVRNLTFSLFLLFFGLIGLFFIKINKTLWGLSLILIFTGIEFLYLANKYLPFSKKDYLFPEHPLFTFLQEKKDINRFWGGGISYVGTNIPTYYRLYYPEGYDSLYIKRYGELINADKNGQKPQKIPRSDVNISDSALYKDKILDLLGVKYILDKTDIPKWKFEPEPWKFPPERYKLIWQNGKFKVYENLKAFPRIYFAEKLIYRNNDYDILQEIYLKKHSSLFAITEESLPKNVIPAKNGVISLTKYSSREINITTKNNDNNFLVISDTYFPGWKAYLDGKEIKIYRTNYAFRGIIVPKGKHLVSFIYNPLSYKLGLLCSVSGIIFLFIFYIYYEKKNK